MLKMRDQLWLTLLWMSSVIVIGGVWAIIDGDEEISLRNILTIGFCFSLALLSAWKLIKGPRGK